MELRLADVTQQLDSAIVALVSLVELVTPVLKKDSMDPLIILDVRNVNV